MRILVAVCRVPDASQPLRIADGALEQAGTRMVLNPYDEAALEAALQLKDRGPATEVVAATVGTTAAADVLRTALASGADRAIHVATDLPLSPLFVARALHQVVRTESPDLVLLGRQTTDWSGAQVGPMVAGLIGWAQVTEAVSLAARDRTLTVEHKADGGVETVEADLPCVVTADLRLGTLRFANLNAVLAARKKPISVHMAPPVTDRRPPQALQAAEQQRRRIAVHSGAELAAALRREKLL